MKLVFDGLECSLPFKPGYSTVLQVENQALFFRVGRALKSQEGRYAIEPYLFWDNDSEIAPKDATLFIADIFDLPWDDCALLGEIIKHIEKDLIDDEDARIALEETEQLLSSKLMALSGGLSADYSFGLEWSVSRSLKMLGFGIDSLPDSKLIDNLISFLSLALDARCNKIFVFVNLKTFLTEKELKMFYEHVFYTKKSVLLLENKQDNSTYQYEIKHTVDQEFLEY